MLFRRLKCIKKKKQTKREEEKFERSSSNKLGTKVYGCANLLEVVKSTQISEKKEDEKPSKREKKKKMNQHAKRKLIVFLTKTDEKSTREKTMQ